MGNGNSSSSISEEEVYKDKEEVPVLVLLSDLYSELEVISVSVSRPSFCSILHYLLNT